jgi:ABC-2 type transport system permease protein
MRSALAAERIKLLSTRSPWWSMIGAIAFGVGLTVLHVVSDTGAAHPATTWDRQFGVQFAMPVAMIMAALSVTTEYRFGTIRTTFLAVPGRWSALAAKTVLVAVLAALIGELTAFLAWGASAVARPEGDVALDLAWEWRMLAGAGAYYAGAAVLSVALALVVRQTAGVVAALVAYPLAGELVLSFVPGLERWLPLNVGKRFLTAGFADPAVAPGPGPGAPSNATLSPGWALASYLAIALIGWVVAVIVAGRRDA